MQQHKFNLDASAAFAARGGERTDRRAWSFERHLITEPLMPVGDEFPQPEARAIGSESLEIDALYKGAHMTSPSNEQIVREFFNAMGPTLEDFKRNYAERMSEDVVWESVGIPAHQGKDACIAYLDDLHRRTGMEYCTIEVLHMASDRDVVLTERLDTMYRADGTPIKTFRIMGATQLRDGRITRYTDYFDTLSVASMASGGTD